MSSDVSNPGLNEAIVHSVEHGTYPESESVSSAALSSSVLPALLADLQKARDEVKADIRQLSRDVAPDVDGWIAQAKKLQTDIERSKATARDIVQQAEAGKKLKSEAEEAANKAGLLAKEVSFNKALVETLNQFRNIRQTLDDCQNAMVQGDLSSALGAIKQVGVDLPSLAAVENTRAYDLISKRDEGLKSALAEQAAERARALVDVRTGERRLAISEDGTDGSRGIESAIDALSFLGARTSYLQRLRRDLDSTLFQPRISRKNGSLRTVRTDGNTISIIENSTGSDVISTLDDIWIILDFLNTRLPRSICLPLSDVLLPSLINDVTDLWLNACVPIRIDEMPFFQQVLDRVSKLADQIDALEWSANTNALREWVQSAPRTWLAKRRETALGAVRSLLFTKLKERKVVERFETQMVSKGDALMGANDGASDDAWDTAWEEEEPESSSTNTKPAPHSQPTEDDDDLSAWDVEDEQPDQVSETSVEAAKDTGANDNDDNDDDADAWGWGDDEQVTQDETKAEVEKETQQSSAGKTPSKAPTEREVTLKETYTVTAVPDGILEIIEHCILDAETLTDSSYAHTPIGPAASALYTLPTFALAMYRATASTAYGRLDTGNMLIYNDSTRLADRLRAFVAQQAQRDITSPLPVHQRPTSRLKLDNDIKALDSFAKRAYSSEMESQRTIIKDMLDGAQSFENCTVEPYASACESAVDITAGRLQDVHGQWEHILSRSALLQSLGSLLGTATSKMILEIEDLSDIGEEESKKLKSFCDKVSEVKGLFVQEHPESGHQGDMTGIYCPNWFKFQYLGEILESSLADIKYLWTEGELRLEFDVDEVVDLVQALFADSDYRRKAIADVRRAAR